MACIKPTFRNWPYMPTDEQRNYMLATHTIARTGGPFYTDDDARKVVDDFEADPKNEKFAAYQLGWLLTYGPRIRAGELKKF